MTSRFPGPWRYSPNSQTDLPSMTPLAGNSASSMPSRREHAGHAGFLTIDDARQIAVDFARLPELLNQTSVESEVATSTKTISPVSSKRIAHRKVIRNLHVTSRRPVVK